MNYRIEYRQSVTDEDTPSLPKAATLEMRKAIEQKLISHAIGCGNPLRYSVKGPRRLRVGDYRVIFRIEPPD